jgi:hypothetical protein
LRGSVQHATADLIQLDGFEQCLEVALTKALVALALDDLEEHGPDDGVREDLQQDAVLRGEPSMRMRSAFSAARSS